MCFAPHRRALFRHLNVQKVVRSWGVLYILTSKCASRHNGVHFFDDFRRRKFELCSEREVFLPFSLANVLRFTTACTYSTSQLPKVVRAWCAFYILTSKCASHHNGVQFFISHLPSGLRTRRCSEPTFDPPEPQIIGKTQCFATFLPFRAPGSSFFWPFLFFDLLSSSLLFADSSHLCFSSVHIVGSLTSKLRALHTYIHTYTHTHTYIHTYIHRYIHRYIHILGTSTSDLGLVKGTLGWASPISSCFGTPPAQVPAHQVSVWD